VLCVRQYESSAVKVENDGIIENAFAQRAVWVAAAATATTTVIVVQASEAVTCEVAARAARITRVFRAPAAVLAAASTTDAFHSVVPALRAGAALGVA